MSMMITAQVNELSDNDHRKIILQLINSHLLATGSWLGNYKRGFNVLFGKIFIYAYLS